MKVSPWRLALLLLLWGAARLPAAVHLFGSTFWAGDIVYIDQATGVATPIATFPSCYDVAGRDGRLYAFYGGSVREIDPATGRVLILHSFNNAIPGGEGSFTFRSDGMAFATKSLEATGTLFRLEFTNRAVTSITTNGGLSPSLDGLAFDAGGTLYGLQQNRFNDFGLYTVDANTGQTALIGKLGVSFSAANGAVAGLAFAPDRSLYAAIGNQSESRLYSVNKNTGAATYVRAISSPGISGIAFVSVAPGPLTINRGDGQVRLSWPRRLGGALETAPTVNGLWTPLRGAFVTNITEVSVVLDSGDSAAFYRLVE